MLRRKASVSGSFAEAGVIGVCLVTLLLCAGFFLGGCGDSESVNTKAAGYYPTPSRAVSRST